MRKTNQGDENTILDRIKKKKIVRGGVSHLK